MKRFIEVKMVNNLATLGDTFVSRKSEDSDLDDTQDYHHFSGSTLFRSGNQQ